MSMKLTTSDVRNLVCDHLEQQGCTAVEAVLTFEIWREEQALTALLPRTEADS